MFTPSFNTIAAVIGGGPAGLMAAERLSSAGLKVTVYERMPSLARKFLMAGRGGLNLTHSESLSLFISRYGDADMKLTRAIEQFPPARLRAFSEALGEPTFVGSTGRVFPKSMKASPLLRAWLKRLDTAGVRFALRHHWIGWDAYGALLFETPDGARTVSPRVAVLALGGASWPRLGSDGGWVPLLQTQGIAVRNLQPANCGFQANWSAKFVERFEGVPLKRIALGFAGETVRGEAMITRSGIEGGAVYALSRRLREAVLRDGEALLFIDLLPELTAVQVAARLGRPRGKTSLSTFLRKSLPLAPAGIALAQEATRGRLAAYQVTEISHLLKAVPLRLTGIAPIARAISSAGGVCFDDIDEQFMLTRKPGVFVAGEMLDWEAPTGGYLLQACFATGSAAGEAAARWAQTAGAPPVV